MLAELTVRRRVSTPNFECYLVGDTSKGKTLNSNLQVSQNNVVARAVQELFTSLTISDQHESYGDEALGANRYMPLLRGHVLDWVEQYGLGEDVRFKTQDNE